MARQNRRFNILQWCAYISLGIGLAMLIVLLVVCITIPDTISWEKLFSFLFKSLKENPGEFIGGTVGTLFTLTATIFLFITFKEQRLQFESTQNSEFYTRFETTYFNMLGMLEKVQDSVNANIEETEEANGLHNLAEYYKRFKANYMIDLVREVSMKNIAETLSNDELIPADVLKAKQYFGDYFENYVKKTKCNIGYFYRYIYNIVNFVCCQKNFKQSDDKEHYLNLLQAQLSDEELALIFYDAISKYGENKEGDLVFRQMLDETHFLENIKPEVLLDRNHCFFYPKTIFKYMSRDDKKKSLLLV